MTASESAHPAWAEVDLEALERNYLNVERKLAPGVRIIASIKADAYGHGVVEVARRLETRGALALATGDIEEALALRRAGIAGKILMFAGPLPEGLGELLAHDLVPTIYDRAGAEALSAAAAGRPAACWIKVDCGLGRLGVEADKAEDFVVWAAGLPDLAIEGVYTHVPFAERAGAAWSKRGLDRFDALIAAIRKRGVAVAYAQARASSGVLMGLSDSSNAVCVGHVLYGLSSMAPGEADMTGFEPILKAVRGRLVHVGRHAAGRDMAIGGLYGLNSARTTGVVPLGVTNGLRGPAAGKQAYALVRGRRVPVIAVSLEHCTLDLTEVPEPQVGETVTLLGTDGEERIAIEDMAAWQERSPLEVAMTFSKRLPFRYESHADDVWGSFGKDAAA